jgi:hypothetical protein
MEHAATIQEIAITAVRMKRDITPPIRLSGNKYTYFEKSL